MQSETPSARIIVQSDVSEFFHDLLTQAVASQKSDVSDALLFYLVELLRRRTLPADPLLVDGEDVDELPLALLMSRALASNLDKKVILLRSLGDRSLYISGFFAESLRRKIVDVDYYIRMGGSAFGTLAGVARCTNSGRTLAVVYGEIAEKFAALVKILTSVSYECSFEPSDDLLRLYDAWIRTRSARLAKQLEDKGILPLELQPTAYTQ